MFWGSYHLPDSHLRNRGSQKQVVLDTLELEVEGTLTAHLGNTANPPDQQGASATQFGSEPPKPRRRSREPPGKAVEAVCPIYNMLKTLEPIKGRIIRGPCTEEKEEKGGARESLGMPADK